MIRWIVPGLDGTLLRTEKAISPRTAGVLARCQSKSVTVVFATARSKQNSQRFLEQFSPDLFIGHGGALTLMEDHPAEREAVPPDTAARLIRRSLDTPEVRAPKLFGGPGVYPLPLCRSFGPGAGKLFEGILSVR